MIRADGDSSPGKPSLKSEKTSTLGQSGANDPEEFDGLNAAPPRISHGDPDEPRGGLPWTS
jgi:hypothetical protein